MQIKLNPSYLLAMGALIIVLKEVHELSHILTSYLFFGCWGPYRDFNVITMCTAGEEGSFGSLLASINGPLFSYTCMWAGMVLLLRNTTSAKWLGFSLLFAAKPFARFFTALMNGGDELGVLRSLLSPALPDGALQLTGISLILTVILPPLWIAYLNILNPKKVLWFMGFLLLPMFFDFILMHSFFNALLKAGLLASPFLFGTPALIHLVFLAAVLVLILFHKALFISPLPAGTITPLETGERDARKRASVLSSE
jgi:hypothetical protein